jgi:hypothetical protein
LFFLSYLSISLVSLVRRIWALCVILPLYWCVGLSSLWRFVEVKVRSLLLLGSWNPWWLCGALLAILGSV